MLVQSYESFRDKEHENYSPSSSPWPPPFPNKVWQAFQVTLLRDNIKTYKVFNNITVLQKVSTYTAYF